MHRLHAFMILVTHQTPGDPARNECLADTRRTLKDQVLAQRDGVENLAKLACLPETAHQVAVAKSYGSTAGISGPFPGPTAPSSIDSKTSRSQSLYAVKRVSVLVVIGALQVERGNERTPLRPFERSETPPDPRIVENNLRSPVPHPSRTLRPLFARTMSPFFISCANSHVASDAMIGFSPCPFSIKAPWVVSRDSYSQRSPRSSHPIAAIPSSTKLAPQPSAFARRNHPDVRPCRTAPGTTSRRRSRPDGRYRLALDWHRQARCGGILYRKSRLPVRDDLALQSTCLMSLTALSRSGQGSTARHPSLLHGFLTKGP